MKNTCTKIGAILMIVFLVLPSMASSRHISRPRSHQVVKHRATSSVPAALMGKYAGEDEPNFYWIRRPISRNKNGPRDTLHVAGSSLPDCSHACGSCSPCRLVMVSFVCSTLEEAETCPMAYKCMCKNKSYPVP